mmetsp:Transcript_3701/g.8217  ORF Transcript_3701/g.8217 Transcript_3701/m.8217 type:complete len:91 (+) Transcript_3701:50-322(+)
MEFNSSKTIPSYIVFISSDDVKSRRPMVIALSTGTSIDNRLTFSKSLSCPIQMTTTGSNDSAKTHTTSITAASNNDYRQHETAQRSGTCS